MKKGALLLLLLILFSSFVSAGELKVTNNHPFLINNSWIQASDLKVGDLLSLIDGRKAVITSIQEVQATSPFLVYNLEDYIFHNYIIGEDNIIVHNSNILVIPGVFNKLNVNDATLAHYNSVQLIGNTVVNILTRSRIINLVISRKIKNLLNSHDWSKAYEKFKLFDEYIKCIEQRGLLNDPIYKDWNIRSEYQRIHSRVIGGEHHLWHILIENLPKDSRLANAIVNPIDWIEARTARGRTIADRDVFNAVKAYRLSEDYNLALNIFKENGFDETFMNGLLEAIIQAFRENYPERFTMGHLYR